MLLASCKERGPVTKASFRSSRGGDSALEVYHTLLALAERNLELQKKAKSDGQNSVEDHAEPNP